ncbi:3-methylornithine--L-lysine ligase PylC [Acidobacteriota bacterium]
MKVAVMGGKLQGIEAAYLARKAGWEVLLIDKNFDVPARGLSDIFLQFDLTSHTPDLSLHFQDVDLIIPALEDQDALISLEALAFRHTIPLAFDSESHSITSSKKASDRLFKELGLSSPRLWPDCGFPLIAKPSGLSGSRGILKIRNTAELDTTLDKETFSEDQWILQEFLEGPSYSIEVFGFNRNFWPLQTTVIEVDRTYDCKRVIAPADLPESLQKKLSDTATAIGKALNLKGIMDVEVILHENQLKVLEIDARLPSQTPTAVLKSTGINMLELLYSIFSDNLAPEIVTNGQERSVIFEHVRVTSEALEVCGEHIMAESGPLRHRSNFFGADEALTDYERNEPNWTATLIMTGENAREVGLKRRHVIETIQSTFGLAQYIESFPE